jgi:hypothetical protein
MVAALAAADFAKKPLIWFPRWDVDQVGLSATNLAK